MHSRKLFLFSNNEICIKNSDPNFDATMGSLNGSEWYAS